MEDVVTLARQQPCVAIHNEPTIKPRKLKSRTPYSREEDELLIRLKERRHPKLSCDQIQTHFPDRNSNSIQAHYSTCLKHRRPLRNGLRSS